ncbi:hypothetical protein OFM35_08245 [Escherichia coli]|nr:hypothetical protein [Escherichia coli]
MLGGADNPNGELLSYIIGADTFKADAIYIASFFTWIDYKKSHGINRGKIQHS